MMYIKKIFFSTRSMTLLLLVYGISMAVATFIESSYDTPTAKTLVYDASWFEVLMLWLIVLFAANIKTYRLTRKEKWPILVFHLAFIFMFIGGAITRYTSFEGQMAIVEGQTTNEIISDQTYFKLAITNGTNTRHYNRHPYRMSQVNSKKTPWPLKKTYTQNYLFNDKKVSLKTLDYIPLAKDSIQITEEGKPMLQLVTMGESGREEHFISQGDIKNIAGTRFSFNKPLEGTVQLTETELGLTLKLPDNGHYVSMEGQEKGVVRDTSLLAKNSGVLNAHNQIPLNYRTLYRVHNISFIVPNKPIKGQIVYYSGDKNNPKDKQLLDVVQIALASGNQKDTLYVKGGKGVTDYSETLKINGLDVSIGYGSKIVHTDFYLRCNDFLLERYPGSNNPSSYESHLTIIDAGQEQNHHVFMNHVLDYKGYRFFQASYFPDESGTILSVNADKWGTNITYFGYVLLFAGMFFTLFWKGTRFWNLHQSLKKMRKHALILLLAFFGTGLQSGFSQKPQNPSSDTTSVFEQQVPPSTQFAKPQSLGLNRQISPEHAKKFGQLLVQDYQGRIKPMNTHSLELLRKLYKHAVYTKDSIHISSEQWFISMQVDPGYWANQPLIKVSEKGGEQFLKEVGSNQEGYTSYAKLVDLERGAYKLQEQYNRSFSKRQADQTNYDKAVIQLTERFYIFSNVAFGYYTKVIPVKNDSLHRWRSWVYRPNSQKAVTDSLAHSILTPYFNGVKEGLITGDWRTADAELKHISNFQQTWGAAVIPSQTKISLEILYNQLNTFFWLMILYGLLGALLVVLGFADVLMSNKKRDLYIGLVVKVLLGIMVAALLVQSIALGVRWYLSGHAPWSNGYEAIIFISGVGVFSGLLLYRNRNAFIPAAGALVAMIMMGFAHGGSMLDPQITPLEPVLKSYWLMVHVGIITSSYGFFGLSALLAVISLLLFSLKPAAKVKRAIKELTRVNEMALTIGIFALGIGTFLGGMWANESWGRYWSWDPKETWAFISVIIYAVVLHLRLVPKLKSSLTFNLASMWAIWTIIFTYFGVNYYLVGLHSYAAGDPIPIPLWIYISVAGMCVLSVLAYYRTKKQL